jgi:hypothetical protein
MFSICQLDWFAKIPCDETVRSHPVRMPHPDSIGWPLNNVGFSRLRPAKSMDRKCWLRRGSATGSRSVVNILKKNSFARENILLTKIVCSIMLTLPARIRDMSANKHWLSAQQAFTFARQSPVNLFRTRRFMR